jgi:hypothetical protein
LGARDRDADTTENIFWCDGSERENEFLIAESLKQNVLID